MYPEHLSPALIIPDLGLPMGKACLCSARNSVMLGRARGSARQTGGATLIAVVTRKRGHTASTQ